MPVKMESFYFNLDGCNHFCYVDKRLLKISKILNLNNTQNFKGNFLENMRSLFLEPLDSTNMLIFKTANFVIGSDIEFPISSVSNKALILRDSQSEFLSAFPLIL